MANNYRSKVTYEGKIMAGARALWKATGVKDGDFGKPIIAVANSFTQFVPGHVHLHDVGQLVVQEIEKAGGIAKEFNTIAVDDGIAMGHTGMLYSLPSRDIIADSVEYMVNAHKADALVCISNCDKVTPGMLMASMRLNIPVIFVSGGPMEAGKMDNCDHKVDLIDAMIVSAEPNVTDEEVRAVESAACPTCGSCSGMFTANSMNSLTEALGLSLPGNGSLIATHAYRKQLFVKAAQRIVEMAKAHYEAAIEASFETAGVPGAAEAIKQFPYDQTNYKKCIGVSKWIALAGVNTFEGWCEARRLDFPAFGSVQGSQMYNEQTDDSYKPELYVPGTFYTPIKVEDKLGANKILERWPYPESSSARNSNCPDFPGYASPVFWGK